MSSRSLRRKIGAESLVNSSSRILLPLITIQQRVEGVPGSIPSASWRGAVFRTGPSHPGVTRHNEIPKRLQIPKPHEITRGFVFTWTYWQNDRAVWCVTLFSWLLYARAMDGKPRRKRKQGIVKMPPDRRLVCPFGASVGCDLLLLSHLTPAPCNKSRDEITPK